MSYKAVTPQQKNWIEKNYDRVSITDMEKELGFSRTVVYRVLNDLGLSRKGVIVKSSKPTTRLKKQVQMFDASERKDWIAP